MLIVAGTLTTKMAGPLVRLWEQMPSPSGAWRWATAPAPAAATSVPTRPIQGIDRVMPVDVYVPGCPPRPEGLIYGMLKLQQLIMDRRGHWRRARHRADRAGRRLRPAEGVAAIDTALKRRLETALAGHLAGPVTQRHDTTEVRIARGRRDRRHAHALHDDPSAALPAAGRPVRRGHRHHDAGRLPRLVDATPDWLRVIVVDLPRNDPRLPSITFLWKGAEWGEREAYDMFGIIFEGNRDLRRIYMPPDYASRSRCARTSCCRTTPRARRPWASDTWSRRRRLVRGTSRPAGQPDGDVEPWQTEPKTRVRSPDDDPLLMVDTPARPSTTPSRPTRRRPSARPSSMRLREGEMLVNLGPAAPSTHGVLRVVLKIDGERVVDLDPVLGYLHRGVEKICENSDWHMVVSHCDPLEYIASMFSEAGAGHGRREAARRQGAAARRVHPCPGLRSSTGSPAMPCSSAGWRSTWAA